MFSLSGRQEPIPSAVTATAPHEMKQTVFASPQAPNAEVALPESAHSATRAEQTPKLPEPTELPDFEALKNQQVSFEQEWARRRVEILRDQLEIDSDVFSELDVQNSRYLEAKKKILESSQGNPNMISSELFEGLAKLNQAYREELKKLMGSDALKLLESEQRLLVSAYSLDGYSIPVDVF